MTRICVKDIQKGMTLAKDATDRGGTVLLKQGAELSEKHIKTFKTWGVTHVEIEGSDNETPLQEILAAHPEYLEEANLNASKLFYHADQSHPFFVELIALWKQKYVLRKARQS